MSSCSSGFQKKKISFYLFEQMFLRVFMFYHLIFEVLSITKIISINGEVESGPVPTPVDSDSDCPTSCYFNSDCILASLAKSGQCSLYLFSALTPGLKIAKSTETTESIVYFKVSSTRIIFQLKKVSGHFLR